MQPRDAALFVSTVRRILTLSSQPPWRVLHLINDLSTGGAQAMLEKLVTRLPPDRFQTLVVSMTELGPIGARLRRAGIAVETLGFARGSLNARPLFRLVRLARTFRPHLLQSWLYYADFAGVLASFGTRIPHLLWNIRCSDMDFSAYAAGAKTAVSLLAKLSGYPDAVITNATVGLNAHAAFGYRPRQWKLIPNGFDTDRFRPDPAARTSFRARWKIPDHTFLVGLPARVDPMKDHATFLRAARMTLQSGRPVQFVLIGRGATRDNPVIADLIADAQIGSALHAAGEQSAMEAVLPALDLAVLSSAFGEGFPNVLGESMACGVPCVSTDVGDARAILNDTGTIVAPRDPEALSRAIAAMADMPGEAFDDLRRAARARVAAHYSLDAIVATYATFYEEIIGPRP
jgi:glycosyltransferase involved in cell wall biosynthesis